MGGRYIYVWVLLCVRPAAGFSPRQVPPRARTWSRQRPTCASGSVEDPLVLMGDASALCLYSVIQAAVDQLEPAAESLGGDLVADYRLQALANPTVGSVVLIVSWILAGLLSGAYRAGARSRTVDETFTNLVQTFAIYLPIVGVALVATSGGPQVAAPDLTFCLGAVSIIASWRVVLASVGIR